MRISTQVMGLINSFKRQMIAMEAMKVKTLVNLNGRLKVIIAVRFISIQFKALDNLGFEWIFEDRIEQSIESIQRINRMVIFASRIL